MRFECNCTNEAEFRQMVTECHKEDCGWNFEVGARLWYTPEGEDFTLMVEYQIMTQTWRKDFEEDDEPDWFTVYAVDDEKDDDCSDEIVTAEAKSDIKLVDLKKTMIDFAKQVFDMYYPTPKIKHSYGCDICGERKDWDNEIHWITSSYGVCDECYEKLNKEDIARIEEEYE